MPCARSHAFSRCRFCVMCSTSAFGCSGTSGAIAASGADGMFSNSYVTTSHARANAVSAAVSS